MKRLLVIVFIWIACCGFTGLQKPLLGTQLNKAHPISQGLSGCWLMNEGTGKVLNDYSGNNNLGFLTGGVKWMTESNGPVLKFDGSSGYVKINNPSFAYRVQTISAWIKTTTFPEVIFSLANPSSNDNTIYFSVSVVGKLRIYVKSNVGLLDCEVTDAGVPSQVISGFWTHVVLVANQRGKFFYKNGVSQGNSCAGDSTWLDDIGSGINTAAIGVWAVNAIQSYFNGSMDRVMVWNRDLNPSEVRFISDNPYAMFETSVFSQPYLNFGSGGAPPVVVPKRRQSFIQISWWEQMMRNLGIG